MERHQMTEVAAMPRVKSPPAPARPGAPVLARGNEPVTAVHLAAEYYPFARTGGLAEAASCLADFQRRAGMEVIAIVPLHRSVRVAEPDLEPVGGAFPVQVGPRTEEARLYRIAGADGTHASVYFVESAEYFDRPGLYGEGGADYPDNPRRFAFFCKAAVTALPRLVRGPSLLHVHDWHTALAPVYLRTVMAHEAWTRDVAVVTSVHNAGYQGYFGPEQLPDLGLPWDLYDWRRLEWHGHVNFLKGALVYSDAVVTVSPTHAGELRTPDGGFGLHDVFQWLGDRFVGILNGIDQQTWNPATDTQITARYDAADLSGKQKCKTALQRAFGLPQRKRLPVFGLTGRMVRQKGLDLVLGSPELLDLDAQFVFLGSGDTGYEQALLAFAARAPEKVAVQLDFSDRLEHRLMAGTDIFLMPSQYEPCGLTQMRAQRYGAVPVGRRVGGLADTIDDDVTGFLFDAYTPEAFRAAVARALGVFADGPRWQELMRAAMAHDFSWERATGRYLDLYRRVAATVFAG
jgi:starch synthase